VKRAQRAMQKNQTVTQMPFYSDACVGRETELQSIERWLKQPDAQLLTLEGRSGIGKTRLACEFLKRAQQSGVRGIYVNLTLLQNAAQILPSVFHALNIPFPGEDVRQRLARRLFENGVLLLLDDFDRLLPDGASVVQDLLRAAPGLKVLTTSQKPLGIAEEQVLRLPPLSVPPADLKLRSLDALREYPSAALLLNQVGSAQSLQGVAPAEIARLCRDLEGHPGKLVDAGLFLRTHYWTNFARSYREWFGLESRAMLYLKPESQRHRLFRDLRVEEQRAVRCLSVFPDQFDLNAAAAAMLKTPDQAIPFLHVLKERGFVEFNSDETHYRLTRLREVIPPLKDELRDVVLQRLHAHYLRDLQETARSNQPRAETRHKYFVESDNLLLVLKWLEQQRHTQVIIKLIRLLHICCCNRPPAKIFDWELEYASKSPDLSPRERAAITRLLIEMVGSSADERAFRLAEQLRLHQECALEVGRYWHNQAQGDQANEHYYSAWIQADQCGDRVRAVNAAASWAESEAVLGNLDSAEGILREIKRRYPLARLPHDTQCWYYYVWGYLYYQRGKFVRSRELYQHALAHCPQCPNTLRELSRVYLELGDYQRARDSAEEALKFYLRFQEERDEAAIHAVYGCLGDVSAVEGHYDEACDYHLRCLEFWKATGQPRWICWTLNRLAETELLAQDARHPWRLASRSNADALSYLQQAWQVIEPTYLNLSHRTRTLHNLGWLAWHEERIQDAEQYLNKALEIREKYGNQYGVARTLEILARVRFDQGNREEGVSLFKRASAIRERLEAVLYPQIKYCNHSVRRRRR
jgi:tetratricopeptide (TPR) repeat protein